MSVNHYILSNEQLIDRLVELTEEWTDVNYQRFTSTMYDHPDYMKYEVRKSREYEDIRKEILGRMMR